MYNSNHVSFLKAAKLFVVVVASMGAGVEI
jgi:hypothetical protein